MHRRKSRGPYYEALVGLGDAASPALKPDKARRVRSTAEEKSREICSKEDGIGGLPESSAKQVDSKEIGMARRPSQATRRRAKNGELREDIAAPADKLEKLKATILKARSWAAELATAYDWHNQAVADGYAAGLRYSSWLKATWDAYEAAKEELHHANAVEDEAILEMRKVHELLGTRMPVLFMSNKLLSGKYNRAR